jgi:hypothetical protein
MTQEETLTRQQVVSLIGKHVKELAELARGNGFETLHYFLHIATQQADKEMAALTSVR